MKKVNTFTQIIILRNPVSTHASKAPHIIEEIKRFYPKIDVTILDTSSKNRTTNVKLLARHIDLLGPHTLLCIAAGDGTTNMVAETLLTDQRFKGAAQKTTLLPLWCGNANDLAFMLNGYLRSTTLKHVLSVGKITPIWPMDYHLGLLNREANVRRIAVCYASFGASAFTAHHIENARQAGRLKRKLIEARIIQELRLVLWGLMHSMRFEVEEDGTHQVIYERTFINGPRFAKVNGMPLLKLHDKHFYMVTVDHKTPTALLRRILQLIRPQHTSRFKCTEAAFMIREQTWAQFDGEPFPIDANTTITVRLNAQPLYVLNTKLK